MTRFKVLAASLAVLAAFAVAPAFAQKSKDTLRYPNPEQEPTFDRYNSPGSFQYVWSNAVFDDLLGFDPATDKFLPRLAKSVTQPSPTVYEYELRDDIKWQD